MKISLFSLFPETTDCRPNSDRCRSIESVRTTSLRLVAGFALPDANHSALHRVLSAKAAEVFRVLTNFNLLDLLTQRGTITGAVLADNPDLLRALRLQCRKGVQQVRTNCKWTKQNTHHAPPHHRLALVKTSSRSCCKLTCTSTKFLAQRETHGRHLNGHLNRSKLYP